MSVVQYFENIAELLEQIGPKAGRATKHSVFLECGPMQWNDGQMRGRVYGPMKTEDEAHNYIAIKIERHRLSNATYHGEKGRPPEDDKTYFGHPMFQYRIMTAQEFFGRYLSQIVHVAHQGITHLHSDDEPEVFWPNGTPEEHKVVPLEDEDEWTEEADGEPEGDSEQPLG